MREVIGQFGSGETEREVGGPTTVSVPMAPFARPMYWRSLTNGLGNSVPAITGDSHAHRDLGVQAREVSILWKRLGKKAPSPRDLETESSRGLTSVGARGFEPPTFCSQIRGTRSQPMAADCKYQEIIRVFAMAFPALCSQKQRLRKILLLFCSRSRVSRVIVSACSPSAKSPSCSAYPTRPSTHCARAASLRTCES